MSVTLPLPTAPAAARRVVLCMPINDELDMLRAHLGPTYADLVDYVVVSEAPWTHACDAKPMLLKAAIARGEFSAAEQARLVRVELGPDPLGGGFVNEYSHAWQACAVDRLVLGAEFILAKTGPVYRVSRRDGGRVWARDHLGDAEREVTADVAAATARGAAFVKRAEWSKGDVRCVAEGVQRNALDAGLQRLAAAGSIDATDLVVLVDADEFVDPSLLRALKCNTWAPTADADTFSIPDAGAGSIDGRLFYRVTHSTWSIAQRDAAPLRAIGPPQYGLPFPTTAEHAESLYALKLCLSWHIFDARHRKRLEWGRRQETAMLTTWGAYVAATPHNGTFGRRLPCHVRRSSASMPQIGLRDWGGATAGWHLSWTAPLAKLRAYAEWSREECIAAEGWMRHCLAVPQDPTPLVRGAWTAADDALACYDRQDRALELVDDPRMPPALRSVAAMRH